MQYLDYAATTPLHPEVLKTYNKLLEKYFYNADSMYNKGIEVSLLMNKSRSYIASMLSVMPEEIVFTSGGSESNVTAIKGAAFSYKNRGNHIITTAIEHSSVYETCKQLERVHGFKVTYLPVDTFGSVKIEDVALAITSDTILISMMLVNNELGSIQPINEVIELLKQYPKIKLHCDMVQALGKIKISLEGIDYASFSAHKINGLKGSGILYKKITSNLEALITGGQQESGIRGGTSNACTNIALAKTMRLALENLDDKVVATKKLQAYTISQLNLIDDVVVNTDYQTSVGNVVNFSCIGYKPEVILHDLEAREIYVSTRSACSSKTTNASRVMQALNVDDEIASSAIRISFSYQNTQQDINEFISCLKQSLQTIKKKR